MSQPPDDHLKALWQGQETETPTMTAIAMRALARNYGDNIRGRIWLGVALGAFEVLMFASYAWRAQNEVLRAGWLITLAGVGWMTWRIASKLPSRLPPKEASAAAVMEFHRNQLERQRTGPAWLTVTVVPVFTGLGVAMAGMQEVRPHASPANLAPVAAAVAVWIIAAVVIERRQAKRLAEQIAEMDDLAGR